MKSLGNNNIFADMTYSTFVKWKENYEVQKPLTMRRSSLRVIFFFLFPQATDQLCITAFVIFLLKKKINN